MNKTPLTATLFKSLLTIAGDLPADKRNDFADCSLAMRQHLQNQHTADDCDQILTAVQFRAQALARLRNEPAYRAWSFKADRSGDLDYVHEILVETAATQPLIESGGRPAFDPTSFFLAALERSHAEGCA